MRSGPRNMEAKDLDISKIIDKFDTCGYFAPEPGIYLVKMRAIIGFGPLIRVCFVICDGDYEGLIFKKDFQSNPEVIGSLHDMKIFASLMTATLLDGIPNLKKITDIKPEHIAKSTKAFVRIDKQDAYEDIVGVFLRDILVASSFAK